MFRIAHKLSFRRKRKNNLYGQMKTNEAWHLNAVATDNIMDNFYYLKYGFFMCIHNYRTQ